MEERELRTRWSLVVHDWGGFIGLAWACDHPDRVASLVISNTRLLLRREVARAGRGDPRRARRERSSRRSSAERFATALNAGGDAFDEEDLDAYWRPFEEGRGQAATLGFYRSMDMEKLAPWQGRLAELGVPTLLLWGAEDEFAPISGAQRFKREIPGAELVALEGIGHFVFDQAPERSIAEVLRFLGA